MASGSEVAQPFAPTYSKDAVDKSRGSLSGSHPRADRGQGFLGRKPEVIV